MTSARLRSYHEALSKRVWWGDAARIAGAHGPLFAGTDDEYAYDRITKAHLDRIAGLGSPAECDRVAKEVCG